MKVQLHQRVEMNSSKQASRRIKLRISHNSSSNHNPHLNIQVFPFRTHRMLLRTITQEECQCISEDPEFLIWRTHHRWLVSKYLLFLVEIHIRCMECLLRLQCEDPMEHLIIQMLLRIILNTWLAKTTIEVADEEEAVVDEEEEVDVKEVGVVVADTDISTIRETKECTMVEEDVTLLIPMLLRLKNNLQQWRQPRRWQARKNHHLSSKGCFGPAGSLDQEHSDFKRSATPYGSKYFDPLKI
mmetsp:Transcript_12335/g.20432  ORF Transcript_12335/g.20432 Transcript_12335/m.20432 type:complete len:242 (+) Transcript_12335:1800-2525(+)